MRGEVPRPSSPFSSQLTATNSSDRDGHCYCYEHEQCDDTAH